jgi:hypothetical protein
VPVIAVGLILAWRLLPADRLSSGAERSRLDVTGLGLLAPARLRAWEQLVAEANDHFTIDTVAALVRACSAATTTSRPDPRRATRVVPEPTQLRPGGRAGRRPHRRARGDRPGPAHPRIIDLPFDLFRHEMLMTLKPAPTTICARSSTTSSSPWLPRNSQPADRVFLRGTTFQGSALRSVEAASTGQTEWRPAPDDKHRHAREDRDSLPCR